MHNNRTSVDKQPLEWICTLLDSAHDFFILKDISGRIVYINKKLIEVLGYSQRDIGDDYNYFFYELLNYNEIGKFEDTMAIELKTKYDIKMLFTIKYSSVNSSHGEKIATLGFIKLKGYCRNKPEHCINVLKNQMDIIELTDEGVLMIDSRANIIYLNQKACDLLNIKYSNIINKNFTDIIHTFKPDISLFHLYNGEKILIPVKERALIIECSKLSKECLRTVVIRDVTEDIKYKKLIEQAERYSLTGELAASVIHEIKNSLTSVKGFVQLLQARHKESSTYHKAILDEIDRILELIRSYLGIVKSKDNGNMDIEINSVINQYMLLIEAEAVHRNIKIIKKFNEIPLVRIDGNHLKQLLLNIVQNSFQAIGENGTIILMTKYQPYRNKVIIKIADNGGGIDRDNLKKVLEPLFTTKKEGTGLGLTVCKNILDIYGGNIRILSKKGRGTVVRIVLSAIERV